MLSKRTLTLTLSCNRGGVPMARYVLLDASQLYFEPDRVRSRRFFSSLADLKLAF